MKQATVIVAALFALTACGGSSDSDAYGVLSIAITDAAVEDVSEVWVEFSGITLKPQSGDEIVFDFDTPKSINLLELQNGNTAELLPATRVPAGPYNWIRLAVNAEFDNVFDSYALRTDGSQVELRVPSGSQSGLKLVSGVTVTQDQSTNIVLDWDLRKALSSPQGQPGMHLRPALRVTDMAAFGTLQGNVDVTLLEDATCTNDLVEGTGSAVYVYEGDVAAPDDIDGSASDPLVTATVAQGDNDLYGYQVNYLSIGQYTVALTCQASDDDPEVDDDIAFAESITGVMIFDGEVTVVDFPSP